MTRRRLAFCCLSLALASCDGGQKQAPRAEPSAAPQAAPSLLLAANLLPALDLLKRQAGPNIQALELDAYPDHLVLKARDLALPARVLQHVYRDGRLEKPVPVRLLGAGKLDENLFPLSDAQLDAIPELCRSAVKTVDERFGKVSHVLLRRNLPLDENVQFRVYVQSPAKDGYVDADASGKLLGGG